MICAFAFLADSGGNYATYTGTIPITTATSLSIPFSAFTLSGGWTNASWSSITGEAFAFSSPAGEDLYLGEFDANPGSGTPEPLAWLVWSLAGLGGLGTVVVSRRRR